MSGIPVVVQSPLRDAIVIDMAIPAAPGGALTPRADDFEQQVDQYFAGGVTAGSFTVAADFETSVLSTIKSIARTRSFFMGNPDRFVLVDGVDDIVRARQQGKLAVSFNFQGTNPLTGDLDMLEVYRRLGVGHILLAYNHRNMVGDGCHEQSDGGLSRFGVRVVEKMNEVGIIVDGSHAGYRTSMEMLEVTSAPAIFSHSSPRALCDHERCITDDQIRACARTGGVIGLTGVGRFISKEGTDVSAERIVEGIDYVAHLVGPEHAGLGLDYANDPNQVARLLRAGRRHYGDPSSYPADNLKFAPPTAIPEIAYRLLERGYGETEVRGVLGENWLRVYREVWK
jgi:membrane dipeptidase